MSPLARRASPRSVSAYGTHHHSSPERCSTRKRFAVSISHTRASHSAMCPDSRATAARITVTEHASSGDRCFDARLASACRSWVGGDVERRVVESYATHTHTHTHAHTHTHTRIHTHTHTHTRAHAHTHTRTRTHTQHSHTHTHTHIHTHSLTQHSHTHLLDGIQLRLLTLAESIPKVQKLKSRN
jgi:hypothetical protein